MGEHYRIPYEKKFLPPPVKKLKGETIDESRKTRPGLESKDIITQKKV